ncbi:RNA ligase family protein [Roseimaritima sediminicola]|uniref:RNA ligase family protein n=1 Tax=Roseimaritima sediminicola TaxID=2662066 RepID=UPI00129833A9|nr:RNA ligase family protein [Roseimaritima sediminicola]
MPTCLEVRNRCEPRRDDQQRAASLWRLPTHALEEKVDGANLGILFGDLHSLQLQNRGSFLQEPMTGQWRTLPEWIQLRVDRLFDVLAKAGVEVVPFIAEGCMSLK